jgi:hypothetical protein
MNPEIAVDRVRSFIRWHAERFDALDAPHESIADLVGWTRGKGDKREWWIKPDIWRDTIFDGDEDAAIEAARTLRDLGLLRVQDSRNCQAVVCVRDRKSARAYVVKPEIHEWRPTTSAYGAYDAAQIGLPNGQDKLCPAAISLPQPPTCPANFNELSPAQRQDFLLASAMYLQARLLNSGIELQASDAKAIA